VTDDIAAACRRALGFLELGMPEDALAELDELSVSDAVVLHLRVDALIRLKDWPAAAAICLSMTEQEPAEAGWWIQAAYAQRRAVSIEAAETILRAGLMRHPAHMLMLYNLACYACVLGREDEARELLLRSMRGNAAEVVTMAKRDPDLAPLHPWIDSIPMTTGGT
jgi:predicted Zn-dependent protease